mmetsp:Transcript_224/g.347  ORF Transcript_224/g.347 Transcript_224/m.347 type:complete len:91 (-) Transcript_224:1709-1981(-)
MEMLHRDVGNHARATRTAASVRVALTLVVDAALRCMMAQSIHIAELRFVTQLQNVVLHVPTAMNALQENRAGTQPPAIVSSLPLNHFTAG